eukprot:GILI01018480.1.p1 GENE.GILI01018480.1~~GILI01018480.1.p1  ORF type:complete len:809 (+),score=126.75 GILI01018480.1:89-2428(+)
MSEDQIVAAMSADVQTRLAPVVANFTKVINSIESGERLLPAAENIVSYTTIYNIATNQKFDSIYHDASKKLAELLYSHFQEMLASYARTLALKSIQEDRFARVHAWAKFRTASKWACVVFRYLGCFFLNDTKRNSKYPPLDDVTRAVFFNCCLKKHLTETRRSIFDLIADARDGDKITDDLLRSSVEMFERMAIPSQLSFFDEQFLVPFIEATRDYYDRWSAARVSTCTADDYIQLCGKTLHAEADRFRLLLTARHHRARLLDEVEAALIDNRAANELIFRSPTGLRNLIRTRNFSTAAIAFKLLSTKNKRIEPVAEIVGQELIEDGMSQLEASKTELSINPPECVSKLFELHETYTKLLHDYFDNNITIGRAIQSGLEKVMSEGFKMAKQQGGSEGSTVAIKVGGGNIPVSELLATYCDYCIRQQDKLTTSLDDCFDQAVALLMFATSKDLFQLRARELLCKRLLAASAPSGNSGAEAAEHLLVAKLKRACGSQFTSHYESMLADRTSSSQLQSRFLQYLDNRSIRLQHDFSAQVLKQGIWPCSADDNVLTIPREVAICIKNYVDFHRSESSKRVLKWLHNHSNAVLLARFPKGQKELSMSSYQAGVLLTFNCRNDSDGEAVKGIREIKAATNLDDDQIRRAVGGLVKARVLLPATPQKHLKLGAVSGTCFVVNDQFSHTNRKIAVPTAVAKVTVAASEQLQVHVDEARKPAIQAAIVKIMKSRRQIGHQELLAEAMRYLSNLFTPDARTIKEQIEFLITRDIMRRHQTEHGVYIYVA